MVNFSRIFWVILDISPLQALSGSIVGLYGLALDNHGGVAFLPCLASGGDGAGDVAAGQTEACAERRQCRYQHRDDDFCNLSFTHNFEFLIR